MLNDTKNITISNVTMVTSYHHPQCYHRYHHLGSSKNPIPKCINKLQFKNHMLKRWMDKGNGKVKYRNHLLKFRLQQTAEQQYWICMYCMYAKVIFLILISENTNKYLKYWYLSMIIKIRQCGSMTRELTWTNIAKLLNYKHYFDVKIYICIIYMATCTVKCI